MPEKAQTIYRGHKAVGSRGAEAGKTSKYDKIAEDAERQKFRQANGASGLGGARKASTPEFKKREEAHIAAWRAKKKGQKKASRALPTPKPTPTPAAE